MAVHTDAGPSTTPSQGAAGPEPAADPFRPIAEPGRMGGRLPGWLRLRRRLVASLAVRRIAATRVAALALMVPLVWSRSMHEGTLLEEGLKLAGWALIGVGMIGRIWCTAHIAGHKDLRLVTAGPYSLCRNPLYFFSLLGAVGLGFTTAMVSIPAAITVLFAAVYPGVIRHEEAVLRDRFGDRFEAYRAATPCFWPRRSSFDDGGVVQLNPRRFRRRAFECAWFVWGAALVGVIPVAQAHGLLPVWWHVF